MDIGTNIKEDGENKNKLNDNKIGDLKKVKNSLSLQLQLKMNLGTKKN